MRKFLNIFAVLTLLLLELVVAIPIQLTVSNEPVLAAPSYGNTGGTITTDGLYKVHTFNSSGTFYACATGTVNVSAWGGGGGGGVIASQGGGGGGGGAFAANYSIPVGSVFSYNVTVGTGGTAEVAGGSSSFGYLIVIAAGGNAATDATGGTGATTAASTGDVKYKGGDGKNGDGTGDSGGGGGGAGGQQGAGIDGVAATTTLGGNGGAGAAGSGGAGGLNVSGNNGGNGGTNAFGGGGGAGGDDGKYGGLGGWPGGGGGGGEIAGGQTGGAGTVTIRCLTSAFMVETPPAYTVETLIASSGIWTVPTNVSSIDLLVIGGGGSAGYGGGGAGGAVLLVGKSVSPGKRFYYTVGAGGGVGSASGGINGSPTTFGNITALGGAGGGSTGANAYSGGCGGGSYSSYLPGNSTQTNSGGGTGYGFSGGIGNLVGYAGGGGGIARPGDPASASTGGLGGSPAVCSWNNVSYGAGGSGGTLAVNTPGYNGSANTGTGGSYAAGAYPAAYSGVVVIRYLASPTCTTPNPPDTMSLTATDHSFLLSWNKGTGAYYTRIVRKSGSSPANMSDGTQIYLGTGTSYQDSYLVPGTHYYYRADSQAYIGGYPYSGITSCYSATNLSADSVASDFPNVTTGSITSITSSSALLSGIITALNGTTTISRGFTWDTTPGSFSEYISESGSFGTGSYSMTFNSTSVPSILPATTYYIRAFVTCSNGTSYGTETSFTTVDPTKSSTLITIHDICGTSRTHLPVQSNISIWSFINSSFLASSGLNQEFYESATARYSMLNTSSGWIRTIVPSLVTYGTKDYTWYTGWYPSDVVEDFIPGWNGSVSGTDSMDYMASFTYNVSWSGYINTSATGILLEVTNSFGIGSYGNGSIYGYVLNESQPVSYFNWSPTSDLATGGWGASPAVSLYQNIDDSTLLTGGDNSATFIYNSSTTVYSNCSFTTNASASNASGFVMGLGGMVSVAANTGGYYAKPGLTVGGSTYWGDLVSGTGTTYTNGSSLFNGLPPYGYRNLSTMAPSNYTMWVSGKAATNQVQVSQLYAYLKYCTPPMVTYPVSIGSHSISFSGNSSWAGLYVDGVLVGSTTVYGVPAYSMKGIYMDNNIALATRTATIQVDDYEVLDWGLVNILTGSTLPDTSGYNHNGSVTWGWMPACLNISLGGSGSIEDYSAPDVSGGDWTPPEVIPAIVPTANDSAWWRGTTDTTDAHFSSLPMYSLFKRAADAGWGSVYVLYMAAMIFTAVVLGLITYLATGSYLVACVAVGVCLFAASTTGVISGWIVLIYGAACGCWMTVARSL